LTILFDENERAQFFPSTITETRDKLGIKRYKFEPDYVDHLTLAMQLVTDTLNDYLQARLSMSPLTDHPDLIFHDLYSHGSLVMSNSFPTGNLA